MPISSEKKLSSPEYAEAVTRALGMPFAGLTTLSIDANLGEPVLVRLVYLIEGTPELLSITRPSVEEPQPAPPTKQYFGQPASEAS